MQRFFFLPLISMMTKWNRFVCCSKESFSTEKFLFTNMDWFGLKWMKEDKDDYLSLCLGNDDTHFTLVFDTTK